MVRSTTNGNPTCCLGKYLVSFLVPCHVGITVSAPVTHTDTQILVYAAVAQPVLVTYSIASGPAELLSTLTPIH